MRPLQIVSTTKEFSNGAVAPIASIMDVAYMTMEQEDLL